MTFHLSYERDTFGLAAVFAEASGLWKKTEIAYRRLIVLPSR